MISGTTSSGFQYEVDPEVIKDYEFLELASKTMKPENIMLYPDLIVMVLGEEQKNALVKHLKEIHGRATTEAMTDEYAEIVEALGEKDEEAKN